MKVDPEYMGHEFDEAYIYKFNNEASETDDFTAFSTIIEMAVLDYDKMVFAMNKLNDGRPHAHIYKFLPGIENKQLVGLDIPMMKQDYHSFNLSQFYEFCRKSPIDGSSNEYAYPFIKL